MYQMPDLFLMEDFDSQQLNPQQTQPSMQPQATNNISWLKTLSIGFSLVSFCIAIGVGGYFLGMQKTKPVSQSQQLTPTISQPSPTADPTANPDLIGANWKTYIHGNLTFKYPPDWTAKDFNYANSVIIENMKSSVKMTISEGQYPYGFEGPQPDVKKNLLKVVVNGKEYQATENIIGNEKAYVDLELDTIQKHHILFGTGYPADDDLNISLEDYYASKDTILKILSTFRFTN